MIYVDTHRTMNEIGTYAGTGLLSIEPMPSCAAAAIGSWTVMAMSFASTVVALPFAFVHSPVGMQIRFGEDSRCST